MSTLGAVYITGSAHSCGSVQAHIVGRRYAQELLSFIYLAFRSFGDGSSSTPERAARDDSLLEYAVYVNLQRLQAGGNTTFSIFHESRLSLEAGSWPDDYVISAIPWNDRGRRDTGSLCGVFHMARTLATSYISLHSCNKPLVANYICQKERISCNITEFILPGHFATVSAEQFSYYQDERSGSPPSASFINGYGLCTNLTSCLNIGFVHQGDIVRYYCTRGMALIAPDDISLAESGVVACQGGGGFSRAVCEEVSPCSADEMACRNSGTCSRLYGQPFCLCEPGHYGLRCEEVIDACQTKPCINNGTCRRAADTYSCECPAGTSGRNCQNQAIECLSNPCQNGGTCVDELYKYSCICMSGFDGPSCEYDENLCQSSPCGLSNACLYYGHSTGYACVCRWGLTGARCETKLIVTNRMEPDDVFVLVAATLLFASSIGLCCLMEVARKNREDEALTEGSKLTHAPFLAGPAAAALLDLKTRIHWLRDGDDYSSPAVLRWQMVRAYVKSAATSAAIAASSEVAPPEGGETATRLAAGWRSVLKQVAELPPPPPRSRRYATIRQLRQKQLAWRGSSSAAGRRSTVLGTTGRLDKEEAETAAPAARNLAERRRSDKYLEVVDTRRRSAISGEFGILDGRRRSSRRRISLLAYRKSSASSEKVLQWLATCALCDYEEDPSGTLAPPSRAPPPRHVKTPEQQKKDRRKPGRRRWRQATTAIVLVRPESSARKTASAAVAADGSAITDAATAEEAAVRAAGTFEGPLVANTAVAAKPATTRRRDGPATGHRRTATPSPASRRLLQADDPPIGVECGPGKSGAGSRRRPRGGDTPAAATAGKARSGGGRHRLSLADKKLTAAEPDRQSAFANERRGCHPDEDAPDAAAVASSARSVDIPQPLSGAQSGNALSAIAGARESRDATSASDSRAEPAPNRASSRFETVDEPQEDSWQRCEPPASSSSEQSPQASGVVNGGVTPKT